MNVLTKFTPPPPFTCTHLHVFDMNPLSHTCVCTLWMTPYMGPFCTLYTSSSAYKVCVSLFSIKCFVFVALTETVFHIDYWRSKTYFEIGRFQRAFGIYETVRRQSRAWYNSLLCRCKKRLKVTKRTINT